MKRFRYALEPAREAARARENVAAADFARSRREADVALGNLIAISARSRAVIARASARGLRDSVAAAGPLGLQDLERCLIALERSRANAAFAADRAGSECARARALYLSDAGRRRAFDLHHRRAVERHRHETDLADSTDCDESNARADEARERLARTATA